MPEDVAVGGFDLGGRHHPSAAHHHPAPLAQVAEETVRLLLTLIDGTGHADRVVLPTELIVRESA